MKETIYLTRDESNIIKGILILLIVLGHNHFLMDGEYVRLQIQLYKFHVIEFFILPFFYKMTLLEDGHISQHTFTYEDLGMEKVELSDITGGDAKENAEILLSVLKNEASPYLETTVLNAGLGFFANGKVATIKEGVELARQLIADGSALEKLRQLQEVQV